MQTAQIETEALPTLTPLELSMLREIVGGQEMVDAIGRRLKGESVRSVAARMNISRPGLRGKIRVAKVRMRRVGILTPAMDAIL